MKNANYFILLVFWTLLFSCNEETAQDSGITNEDLLISVDTGKEVTVCDNQGNEKSHFHSGKGIESDPYVICSVPQLWSIQNYSSSHFKLGKSLSLGGVTSTLGLFNFDSVFNGSFDGNGKSLSSLKVNTGEDKIVNVGLFPVIGSSGVVKNLILSDIHIVTNAENLGVIAGTNNGTIDNIILSNVFAQKSSQVGTLAGINNGTILNSRSTDFSLWGEVSSGSIAGTNSGKIEAAQVNNGIVEGGLGYWGALSGTNLGEQEGVWGEIVDPSELGTWSTQTALLYKTTTNKENVTLIHSEKIRGGTFEIISHQAVPQSGDVSYLASNGTSVLLEQNQINNIAIKFTDIDGSLSQDIFIVTHDSEAPTLNITSDISLGLEQGFSSSTVEVKGEFSEASKYSLKVNGETIISNDSLSDTFTVNIPVSYNLNSPNVAIMEFQDEAGNSTSQNLGSFRSSDTFDFTIDGLSIGGFESLSPIVSFISNRKFTYTATGPLNELSKEGNQDSLITLNVRGYYNARQKVNIQALDEYGNAKEVSFDVFMKDLNIAPNIVTKNYIDNDQNFPTLSSIGFTSGVKVSHYFLFQEDQEIGNGSNQSVMNFSDINLSIGDNSFNLKVTDLFGDEYSYPFSIYRNSELFVELLGIVTGYDTINPSLSVNSNRNVTFTANGPLASDSYLGDQNSIINLDVPGYYSDRENASFYFTDEFGKTKEISFPVYMKDLNLKINEDSAVWVGRSTDLDKIDSLSFETDIEVLNYRLEKEGSVVSSGENGRSFDFSDIPLELGINNFNFIVTDPFGDESNVVFSVTRLEPLSIEINGLSSNGYSELNPVINFTSNRPITFEATGSLVGGTISGDQSSSVTLEVSGYEEDGEGVSFIFSDAYGNTLSQTIPVYLKPLNFRATSETQELISGAFSSGVASGLSFESDTPMLYYRLLSFGNELAGGAGVSMFTLPDLELSYGQNEFILVIADLLGRETYHEINLTSVEELEVQLLGVVEGYPVIDPFLSIQSNRDVTFIASGPIQSGSETGTQEDYITLDIDGRYQSKEPVIVTFSDNYGLSVTYEFDAYLKDLNFVMSSSVPTETVTTETTLSSLSFNVDNYVDYEVKRGSEVLGSGSDVISAELTDIPLIVGENNIDVIVTDPLGEIYTETFQIVSEMTFDLFASLASGSETTEETLGSLGFSTNHKVDYQIKKGSQTLIDGENSSGITLFDLPLEIGENNYLISVTDNLGNNYTDNLSVTRENPGIRYPETGEYFNRPYGSYVCNKNGTYWQKHSGGLNWICQNGNTIHSFSGNLSSVEHGDTTYYRGSLKEDAGSNLFYGWYKITTKEPVIKEPETGEYSSYTCSSTTSSGYRYRCSYNYVWSTTDNLYIIWNGTYYYPPAGTPVNATEVTIDGVTYYRGSFKERIGYHGGEYVYGIYRTYQP